MLAVGAAVITFWDAPERPSVERKSMALGESPLPGESEPDGTRCPSSSWPIDQTVTANSLAGLEWFEQVAACALCRYEGLRAIDLSILVGK